jgi:hypothetical protein
MLAELPTGCAYFIVIWGISAFLGIGSLIKAYCERPTHPTKRNKPETRADWCYEVYLAVHLIFGPAGWIVYILYTRKLPRLLFPMELRPYALEKMRQATASGRMNKIE